MTTKRKIASWYDRGTQACIVLTELTPEIGSIWYDIDGTNITIDGYYYHGVYLGCRHTLLEAVQAVEEAIREASRYGQILDQTREFRYA